TVKALAGASVQISDKDVAEAQTFHDQQLQAAAGTRRLSLKKLTPKTTGNLDQDFAGAEIIRFQKSDATAVRSVATWDDQNLYLAWDVRDRTPWVNGAEQPENLYLSGDTVDFQLGTNGSADAKRDKAAAGDLRVSIGNFKGTPTAVLYRPVAEKDRSRTPKTFSSGVIKEYVVADVAVLPDARITFTKRNDGYVIEAAIPLAALEFTPSAGQTLHGDFGVTYGDPAGQRTRLRSYWNNQHTGIVDDAVFELMLEPKNWGELSIAE
ncbi:MAG: sugar-binding protein, partial [Chthoniobacteraceae bacterium]